MKSGRQEAGLLIRQQRERLGLTQREAASLCGVTQPNLSRIESGAAQPNLGTVRRILGNLRAELVLGVQPSPVDQLPREKERSIWLNRLIVAELTLDPQGVIAVARDNVARLRAIHASNLAVNAALDEWDLLLDAGVDAIADTLTSRDDHAADLRQNSPFAGILSLEQRTAVIAAFRRDWDNRQPLTGVTA
jgi:transcriptional regulator with XRE-family HTH domain